MNPSLRLGLVGAGRFATFVADAITDVPDLRVTAVADTRLPLAEELGTRLDATALPSWQALVDSPDVDAVVVATPPSTHHLIAAAALDAGKHVFCEKPLATTSADARDLAEAVSGTGKTLVVDHVLRYNPILRALNRIPLLGDVHRFLFENDAADEDLDDDHWFWDESLSGGIFVEHGVHFFDAATMLIGREPSAVTATAARRAPTGHVDLVTATAAHGAGVLATHTHSFTHAHRCERQLMRLDYGAAEARVLGWIPVEASVDLWTGDAGVSQVEELPDRTAELLHVAGHQLGPAAAITVEVQRNAHPDRHARGRGQDLELPHHVRLGLTLGGEEAKSYVYAQSVRAAMTDLVHSVRTGAPPESGVAEGAAAVAVAEAATGAAASGCTVDLTGR